MIREGGGGVKKKGRYLVFIAVGQEEWDLIWIDCTRPYHDQRDQTEEEAEEKEEKIKKVWWQETELMRDRESEG